ncbi:MAG: response regulator transcription factor [Pleomorphochaeta sp.]
MKILIIEDEKLPREGLYKLLSTNYKGIQTLVPQANGLEGLEIIEKDKPEIILTDISMPDMNGLEMISKIQNVNYKPYIIILSGYSNFEFAQTALSLGVKEYILKPYKVKDIFEKINTAIKFVSISNMHINSINLKGNKVETLNTKILLRYRKDYDICKIINSTLTYLGKYLGQTVSIDHEIDSDKQIILFNINYTDKEIEKKIPTKEELAHRIKLSLKNDIVGFIFNNNIISKSSTKINDILFAHNFYNLDSISYVSEINNNTNDLSYITVNVEKQLSKVITSNNKEESIKIFNKYLDKKIEQKISPSIIYKDIKTLIYKKHNILSNNLINIDNVLDNLKNCFNFEETKTNLSQLFNYIASNNNSIKEKCTNQNIIQTLKIIEENIYCPIYLDEIANKLNISCEHLSRLFKEELNVGFNQYVNKRKLEIAKKLLKQDELKVSEISDKLGFSSPRYFCKVFKKIEGLTTKEYKNN